MMDDMGADTSKSAEKADAGAGKDSSEAAGGEKPSSSPEKKE